MRTLHISVLDKKAAYLNRDGDIVCGNSDYIIEFAFDAEWDGYDEKTARFIWNGGYQDVKFTGTACSVPIVTHTTELKVGVYAGELSTTTSATIPCQKSILCDSSPQGGTVIVDGSGLPVPTAADNGKVLTAENGKAVWKELTGGTSSYTPISITSFSNNAETKEYGETVTDVALSWKLNKTAKTLTLDGETLDVSTTSKTLSGLSITHDTNKTWTLIATDENNAVASKTTKIAFTNGIYYGAAAEPTEYNSAFVLGLTKMLQNSKVSPFTVNAGAAQYIYYALPKRLGTCEFTVGVFTGGFGLVATIAFENAHGYTEDYYIYRSDNANLGSTTVSVA